MTLDQLLMFKTVAEAGSLRAASERLHKTQPAISQGIRQLESQLAITLFSREGYRLALTEQGKKIFQHALRLLNEASEIKQVAKHLASGHEASITLAFEASFNFALMLPILELTQNEFPNTQIVLKQEYISGAIEALHSGTAELIISPGEAWQLQTADVETVLLHRGTLVEVASPLLLLRHPQLARGSELRNEYQIIVQDTGTATGNKEFGVQDGQRRWYVNNFATKKMLIESGMGWGKLPDYLIAQEVESGALKKLALVDRQNELPLTYFVMKNKHNLLGPVASKLWKNLSLYHQLHH